MFVSGLIEAMEEELSRDNFLSHLPEWVLLIILLIGVHCIAGIVMVILLVKRNNDRANEFNTLIENGVEDNLHTDTKLFPNANKEPLLRKRHKEDEVALNLKTTTSNETDTQNKKEEKTKSRPPNLVTMLDKPDESTDNSSVPSSPKSPVTRESLSLLTETPLLAPTSLSPIQDQEHTKTLSKHLVTILDKPDEATTDDTVPPEYNSLHNEDQFSHFKGIDEYDNLEVEPLNIPPLIQSTNNDIELQLEPYLALAVQETGEDSGPSDLVSSLPGLPPSTMADTLIYICNTTSDLSSNNVELIHY